MNEEELEYRMYGLVPYNLSPIQQGIQFGHAIQEFNNMISDWLEREGGIQFKTLEGEVFKAFTTWRKRDKTFIILDGGTTNKSREIGSGIAKGTLNQHADILNEKGVKFAYFEEPDLGDQLTAVVFLVDERVWNRERYPNFKLIFKDEDVVEAFKDSGISVHDYEDMRDFMTQFEEFKLEESYDNWVTYIGGLKNLWLRKFLKNFRLA